MRLGVHVSIAGSIDQAVVRAAELGCNTFQIFLSSPHSWNKAEIASETVDAFRKLYKKYEMTGAVAHSIYLINLATKNTFNLDKSIQSIINNLEVAEKLGLSGLVVHIGSYKDSNPEEGLNTAINSIKQILDNSSSTTPLLLENTAGAGNLIGKTIEELASITNAIDSERVGVCIDTAHAFESGYEIHEEEGLDEFVDKIDRLIGIDKLKAIHLNDSITRLGSNLDRHEEFGKGELGMDGMTRIINHPKLKDIPFIMETPQIKKGEAGKELVDMVRSLQKS